MKWKQYASLAIGRLCGVGAFAIALVICTQMCSAQQLSIVAVRAELENKMVTIRGTKLSFADALAQVGKQTGRSGIADDQPHLQSAELDLHGTAVQALDRIADIFDYTWTVSKQGAILLTKRFRNQLEYPQVNLLEIRVIVQDALTAIKAIPSDSEIRNIGDWSNQIYQEFTPEQKALLKTGIPQSADILSSHQAQLVNEATLNTYFAGTIALWQALATQLAWIPRSFFQLRDFPDFYIRRGDLHAPLENNVPVGREVGYITVIDGQENVMRLNWMPSKKDKKKSDEKPDGK